MTVVFTTNVLYNTDDGDGDGTINNRNLLSASLLSAAAGANQARVTILPGTASPAGVGAITSCWVGRAASAGSQNYNGNQTQCMFGGNSSASVAASAVSIIGAIAGAVLTVASGSGLLVGMVLAGQPGITPGTSIVSFGTGSGGAGTYNLSATGTVTAGSGISGVLPIVSDWGTFGGGETFDNTQDLICTIHTLAGSTVSYAFFAGLSGSTVFFDFGADNGGSTIGGLTNTLAGSITPFSMVEMQISAADVLMPQAWM